MDILETFADDNKIMAVHTSKDETIEKLQVALDNINQWTED